MIKNAFAYVTRKSLKSLIIILVILSMSTLSLISLSIKDATDRASKETLKEPDGIVMIYKRLTAQGSYRWPRDKSEVRNLTWREFDWLMSGIDIEQPKAIKTT